jgi:hypothetical protein
LGLFDNDAGIGPMAARFRFVDSACSRISATGIRTRLEADR